ncbi:ABC transporter transmembrane domain-containing protein [Mesorhizobium koreense]|uniref:ABC transporter transmembrane domain-containing protein n=1 Tax=Mesorhizobium koreense TaxID=3074855 RepID=UPI00287B8ED0|nr:ABC transporter transmembrane domain-containing protein [Mesorhizobium sp. WR6]
MVILVSMPLYFYSLDLPKQIINLPIQGKGFHSPADTHVFLRLTLPFAESLAGKPVILFPGFELTRLPLLLALCFVYTALLVLNGWFKLYINTYKGITGERVLRRLRYEMMDRVLRFPVFHARQAKPSEIAGIIKDEVDPLSDFIGDSYSAPLFLAGQAITALIFLFLQSFFFGFLTLAVIGIQVWVIPRLRRRLLELGRDRQITAREMAGRIGEVLQGMDDVHLNDTSNFVRADFSSRLGTIFFIRLELFKRKFAVKFLNNLLMQLLSVLFYLIGGYFVITGRLDLGGLVASIAAYKDLPTPVKGLIDWDQQRLMAQIRYAHAIEEFSRDDLMPARLQAADDDFRRIENGFEFHNVACQEPGTAAHLGGVTIQVGARERVALLAEPPEGGSMLLEIAARLASPSSGRVLLDGADMKDLSEAVTGRAIGYADGAAYFPVGTVADLLVEVLRNRQMSSSEPPAGNASVAQGLLEARRSGNSEFDPSADWIDRRRIGTDMASHMQSVTAMTGLIGDIRDIGLASHLHPNAIGRIQPSIDKARVLLREKLAAAGLENLVEPFDRSHYNMQSSVAENILFGMPIDPAFAPPVLARNPMVRSLLGETGLWSLLAALGTDVAKTFVEMFADLPSTSALFGHATGPTPEQIEKLRTILGRIEQAGTGTMSGEDEETLVSLSMDYIEPRDRFGLLNDEIKERVVEARLRLRKMLEGDPDQKISFNDLYVYNPSLTIADNILFGRIETNLVGGRARIKAMVAAVMEELDISSLPFEAGLAFHAGVGGRGLSEAQRQKLRLARALMKKPDFLILNRPLATLPGEEQRKILQAILSQAENSNGGRLGILCAPADPAHAILFDRVLMLRHGRIVADDAPEKLLEALPDFAKLVKA